MAQNDPLGPLLRYDVLAAAEKVTGKSSHDNDPDTMAVGLALALTHAEMKRRALTERGDTTFNDTLPRYISIIDAAGFEKVLEVLFMDNQYETHYMNALIVYARRDGLLLSFDTYFGNKSVNSGHVYYNWHPSETLDRHVRFDMLSSGHFNDDVWIGNHDCREALIYNLDRLAANGELLSKWVERPFIWLLNYMETREPDYKTINAARIAQLPAWVQEIITP